MQAFHLLQPSSLDAALAAGHAQGAKFVAGGTDLMQLLKDNVEAPTELVDLEHVGLSGIQAGASELRLGAMARMSDVAAHSGVRAGWPVISQALDASASPRYATWARLAAICCSGRGAAISGMLVSHATSVNLALAAPP